ncbi:MULTISPECIES: hypothetical protein [Bacillus subtilis group]|uniref:hypothetical protein n=1 Tax=Bacillus subtilis group TaxID=653685 RepID=UPI0004E44213|nr:MULTISPECIES: hypothetical protein [Bacillus subtilis group]AYK60041.1 hypothetical protein D9C14_01030 [Bacillus subtilis subsp. subtilis]KFC31068.1 hypothetical protein ZQL_10730 [Bacillus subtilis]MDI6546686.1 hypothetical protein [Bacillus subtilis]MEC0315451.1 hypothetical protein [Bacillus subtilis]MEC0392840.1 hypothetical protein [Bacillus subtilis]
MYKKISSLYKHISNELKMLDSEHKENKKEIKEFSRNIRSSLNAKSKEFDLAKKKRDDLFKVIRNK